MKHVYLILSTLCLILLYGCTKDDQKKHEYVDDDSVITYSINTKDKYQQIDNFGASDAWTFKYVGKNWPIDKRNQLADLLFSIENETNGHPKGIGLSLWRMNFGAGSLEHPYPGMTHKWNTMPCIRNEAGEYDMALDGVAGGQFWFLKAAKERGCEQFLGFCNSPPYYWTKTGYTNAKGNESLQRVLNLKDDYLDDYSAYLTELITRTKQSHGVDFSYVSILNEPEWQADGIESCHANNDEVAAVARSVSSAFTEYGLDTKIVIPESGKPQFVYTVDWGTPDPLKHGTKAADFFNQDSKNFLGGLPNIAKLLASHSYWSVNTKNELAQIRQKVGDEIKKYNIKYWQTEFCILSDDHDLGTSLDGGAVGGSGRDLTMKLGLYTARIIHCDLVFANASAWHWWLGATPFDYKDGLIYLSDDHYNGEITVPKLLWSFGNYSRFIRPKATRIGVTCEKANVSNLSGIMTSAYMNSNGRLVVVMINFSDKAQTIKLEIDDKTTHTFTPYITSDMAGDDLRPLKSVATQESFTIAPKSIITFNEK